jgi:hypothetical protein
VSPTGIHQPPGDQRREHDRAVICQELFPPEACSVALVRRFAADVLRFAAVDVDLVVLLVSELATNSVLHARTDFIVRIRVEPLPVRIEVQDESYDPPVLRYPDYQTGSGRGIMLLDRCAASWGVAALPTGKGVWFECGTPRRSM